MNKHLQTRKKLNLYDPLDLARFKQRDASERWFKPDELPDELIEEMMIGEAELIDTPPETICRKWVAKCLNRGMFYEVISRAVDVAVNPDYTAKRDAIGRIQLFARTDDEVMATLDGFEHYKGQS